MIDVRRSKGAIWGCLGREVMWRDVVVVLESYGSWGERKWAVSVKREMSDRVMSACRW